LFLQSLPCITISGKAGPLIYRVLSTHLPPPVRFTSLHRTHTFVEGFFRPFGFHPPLKFVFSAWTTILSRDGTDDEGPPPPPLPPTWLKIPPLKTTHRFTTPLKRHPFRHHSPAEGTMYSYRRVEFGTLSIPSLIVVRFGYPTYVTEDEM